LNGEPYTVVGVLGPGFLFPVRNVELAIPLAPDRDPWRQNRQSTNFLRAIGRARDGASRAQIEADLGGIARRLQKEFPESYARKKGVMAIPYREETTRNFRPALLVLLAAVLLLLLIACANLANLMLIRANERRGEMAVRRALGASDAGLARPLLIESIMLALGGAALGILLARFAVPGLVALCPANMPLAGDIEVSLPVLGFTIGAAFLSALVFGLVPALRATRADPSRELQGDGRGATGSRDRSAARGLVVMAQVAVMMVLLVGAGLLLQSFQAVMRVEPGFDEDVLTARLSLPRADYADIHRMSRFYRDLEGRLSRLPGVSEVAAVNHVPLNGALASADY
jgi:putative ABC transport system permease protein